MKILGISMGFNSSAALMIDGKIVAAQQEERFNRIKHFAGVPLESIKYCLDTCSIKLDQIDFIAINQNQKSNFINKLLYVSKKDYVIDLSNNSIKSIKDLLNVIKSQSSKIKKGEWILGSRLNESSLEKWLLYQTDIMGRINPFKPEGLVFNIYLSSIEKTI